MTDKLRTFSRAAGVGALVLFTAAGALVLGAAPASAAPVNRYVATTGNDGENDCTNQAAPCKTIQYAVGQAAAGDTINVAAGTYGESVTITKSLTLTGAGSQATTVTGDGDGGPSFVLEPGGESLIDVTLTDLAGSHNTTSGGLFGIGVNLTVQNAAFSDDREAGVLVLLGTLKMSDSLVSDIGMGNSEDELGTGAGVTLAASVATIERSTIRGNADAGVSLIPDILLAGAAATTLAAAAEPPTVATLHASTVSGNEVGGIVNFGGTVHVNTSTVAGNVGGGVVNLGGSSTAVVANSTVSGTVPFPDEPVDSGQGGLIDFSSIEAPNITPSALQRKAESNAWARLAEGHAAVVKKAGRAIAAAAPAPTSGTTVTGSIVGSQAGVPDCFGTVIDHGYNLSSDAANSCKFSAAKHDVVKKNPKLGPLADNGGPTRTKILKKGSPAIDAVPSGKAGCTATATDQRGIDRPQPTNGPCDMGAVELVAKPIVIHPNSLPHGTVGDAYSATLTATGGAYPTYTFSVAPGSSLPDGLTLSSTGHITGTPTKAGRFHVTISVNDPVLKTYTMVIDAGAAPNGNGTEPIAETGTPVMSMTAVGAGTVFAGFLLLMWAGLIGKGPGRHRAARD